MPTIDELISPFAEAIYAKALALSTLDAQLTSGQRARFLESISDDIKKLGTFMPHDVSEAAHAEASDLRVDLRELNWHDQPRFDGSRELFHVEHVVPVSQIRERCLNAKAKRDVVEALMQDLQLAWILKREDAELTRLGYRSKRPEDAYAKAGIVLRPR